MITQVYQVLSGIFLGVYGDFTLALTLRRLDHTFPMCKAVIISAYVQNQKTQKCITKQTKKHVTPSSKPLIVLLLCWN